MDVTATRRRPVAGTTFMTRSNSRSSATMICAPESFIWYSSSRGVYSGFVITTMPPASSVP